MLPVFPVWEPDELQRVKRGTYSREPDTTSSGNVAVSHGEPRLWIADLVFAKRTTPDGRQFRRDLGIPRGAVSYSVFTLLRRTVS